MTVTDFFKDSKSWRQSGEGANNLEMGEHRDNETIEGHERITDDVEYDMIDVYGRMTLGTFKTEGAVEEFLMENPQYRRPGVKIIPTLTFRDIGSLNHIMLCISKIYDTNKKNWFDNKIVDEIAKEFIEKIDNIRSDRSVIGYIQ